MTSFISCV